MVNYLEWTTDGNNSQTHIEQTNVPSHLEIVQQVIIYSSSILLSLNIFIITKQFKRFLFISKFN